MATWYVRHGAAANGDGTAANVAAGAGLPGAWNNLEAVLLNTGAAYGISPGDTVYVMGGVTLALGATRVFYTYGTEASPVTWIAAGDSIFSGASGHVTIRSATSFNSYQRWPAYNLVTYATADATRWQFTTNNSGSALGYWAGTAPGRYEGCRWVAESATTDRHYWNPTGDAVGGDAQGENVFVNAFVQMRATAAGTAAAHMETDGSGNTCLFLSLTVDMTDSAGCAIFATEKTFDEGSIIKVRGLTVQNADPTCKLCRYNTAAVFKGVDLGGIVDFETFSAISSSFVGVRIEDIDGLADDFVASDPGGHLRWRAGSNYPVAAAALPNGTSVSWRAQPTTVAADIGPLRPWRLPSLEKYTSHSAAAPLTVNVPALIINTVSATDRDWYIEVEYTNDSDAYVCESSRGSGSALPASTVSWDKVAYGAATYNKRDLQLTTSGNVKTGSKVRVTICCERVAGTIGEDAFFSPDPNLSE